MWKYSAIADFIKNNKCGIAVESISEIAGAVTDVIINAVLIPEFSASGAAIGTLAAEVVVFLVQSVTLKDKVTDAFRQIHYARITILW